MYKFGLVLKFCTFLSLWLNWLHMWMENYVVIWECWWECVLKCTWEVWVVIVAVLFVNLMVPWNENYKYYLIVMISTLFYLVHFGNSNIVVASLLSQFCLTCYIKGRIKFVRYSNLGIWDLCYFELTDSFVLLGVMSYMIMRERFCSIGVLFMG